MLNPEIEQTNKRLMIKIEIHFQTTPLIVYCYHYAATNQLNKNQSIFLNYVLCIYFMLILRVPQISLYNKFYIYFMSFRIHDSAVTKFENINLFHLKLKKKAISLQVNIIRLRKCVYDSSPLTSQSHWSFLYQRLPCNAVFSMRPCTTKLWYHRILAYRNHRHGHWKRFVDGHASKSPLQFLYRNLQ